MEKWIFHSSLFTFLLSAQFPVCAIFTFPTIFSRSEGNLFAENFAELFFQQFHVFSLIYADVGYSVSVDIKHGVVVFV